MTTIATPVTAGASRARPPATQPAGPDPFQELLRRVKAAGLLDPRPGYYTAKIAFNLAMLAAGWIALALVGNSWWVIAVGVYMAFAYTQTGFVGHDIGHRQVTRSRRGQDLLGLLHGNLLMGFSYGWWVGHHNRHHSNPNHLEKDSDITRRRVIFIPEQGPTRRGRAKQFIVRHQHVLFYPLLVTEGIGLRTESVKALVRKLPRLTRIEATLISVHLAAYFGAVFYLLPPGKGVVFILTMNLLFGLYIGSVFAPNHKGMPIQMPDEDWDWMTRQVVTSRNIRSSYLTDFLYGGLNYQIEHHLFPAMPRASLRRARPMTIEYCREIGMPYYEVGVFRSYAEVVIHLYRTTQAYQNSVTAAAA
ncbi:MAG: Fatty acid desaturase [Pseudonocardiales bacterium]|jgi:fatty acid desaturase|nr:Fatty acid desaturase [Pseudonocardiales bacterium]